MDDFSPELLEAWNEVVSAWFDIAINGEPVRLLPFVNQAHTPLTGAVVEQSIVWNALPGALVNRYGRLQALALADYPYPLTRSNEVDAPAGFDHAGFLATCYYRPQD